MGLIILFGLVTIAGVLYFIYDMHNQENRARILRVYRLQKKACTWGTWLTCINIQCRIFIQNEPSCRCSNPWKRPENRHFRKIKVPLTQLEPPYKNLEPLNFCTEALIFPKEAPFRGEKGSLYRKCINIWCARCLRCTPVAYGNPYSYSDIQNGWPDVVTLKCIREYANLNDVR
jgi:hypothetical protein